jgi:phosphotransferase system enzyme I (PtsI)
MTEEAGRELRGHGASPGVAAGPALRMVAPLELPEQVPPVTDEAAEVRRCEWALAQVAEQLTERAAAATGPAAQVLDAQAMMAADPGLIGAATEHVRAGSPAPWAVVSAVAGFQRSLAAAGGYFAERAADLDDLGHRAVALLLERAMPGLPESSQPYVLVAVDLSPADTVALDSAPVVAIVTERGGPTSHTAILAKAAGLPAVVNCPSAADIVSGQQVVVDGDTGQVLVEPGEAETGRRLAAHRSRVAANAAQSGPGRTADGHPVRLLLNLGAEGGIASAAEVDAEGVGLFRTEFLFLERATAPTGAEQERIYRTLFDGFAGRGVVVRTLDAGSDKPLAFVAHGDEPNPALGVRGFRMVNGARDLLDVQLAAIGAAAHQSGAQVRVMAPMIATAAETAEFVSMARSHGIDVAGVMIEVPAAALRASELLAEADFASIGTNDLSQYTFAADRGLADLGGLLDPWQPALLQLVGMAARAGQALDKPVGVCGEAASDARLAPVLVGLGVSSLSMSPSAVPAVRAELRRHTLRSCQSLAERVLASADPDAARALMAAADGV